MTQEEKDLLLKDLCARLLYGVRLKIGEHSDYTLCGIVPNMKHTVIVRLNENEREYDIDVYVEHIKPYFRPMSSMTTDEQYEYDCQCPDWYMKSDFCNKHHFDYRGLIKEGLALEAPEGMY